MAATATLRWPGVSANGKWFEAEFDIALSGSYTNPGGDPVDFRGKGIPGNAMPTVQFMGEAGWIYKYNRNTNLGDGAILLFQPTTPAGSAPFNQPSTAAYNAGVPADTIIARVCVPRGRG